MERKTTSRQCEACKNYKPMFAKSVARFSLTPRAVLPAVARHVCGNQAHTPLRTTSADPHTAGPSVTFSHESNTQASSIGSESPTSAPIFTTVEPTAEDRVDAATAKVSDLIAGAQSQLATTYVVSVCPVIGDVAEEQPHSSTSAHTESQSNVTEPSFSNASLSTTKIPVDHPVTSGAAAKKTYADAGLQTASSSAATVAARAQSPVASRAPSKPASSQPAPKKPKTQQGWHTLWSFDVTKKW